MKEDRDVSIMPMFGDYLYGRRRAAVRLQTGYKVCRSKFSSITTMREDEGKL